MSGLSDLEYGALLYAGLDFNTRWLDTLLARSPKGSPARAAIKRQILTNEVLLVRIHDKNLSLISPS
jgi:hypothetical protein